MKKMRYTPKQGQYLAFIFYYTKIHGVAPAETDMERYFRVSPPSVHQMVVRLEASGFIERIPGQGRSIRLLLPPEDLPALGDRPPEPPRQLQSLSPEALALFLRFSRRRKR